MIVTDRDRSIINYIETVKFATTKNLAELFFNNGSKNYYIVALKRLKKLVSYGKIHCISANTSSIGRPMTLYYIDSKIHKKNYNHALALANFSAELKKNEVDIISVEPEVYFSKKIRVDAVYKVVYNGKKRLFLAEFDITKKFNTTKYEYFNKTGEWKDYFKKFPRIVSISEKEPSKSRDVNILHVLPDYSNINILLENIK